MPFFIAYNPSPPPIVVVKITTSLTSSIAVSFYPSPTVSIAVVVNPAASHMDIASEHVALTPPNIPLEGDGLI